MSTKKPRIVHYTAQGRVYRARVNGGPDNTGAWRWRRQEQLQSGHWRSHGTGWARPEHAQRLLRDLHRGLSVDGPLDRAGGLHDLLSMWLAVQEERADLAPRTVDNYAQVVRRLGRSTLGLRDIRPHELDTHALGAFVRRARAAGLSDITLGQDLKVLSFAWRWGQEQGDIPTDLELPKVRLSSEGRELYTPDHEEVMDVVQAVTHEPTRRMVLLGLATGARRMELVELRWADVRFDGEQASVRFRGKTGRRRTPVGPRTTAMLRAWLAADDVGPADPVLRAGSRPPSPAYLYRCLCDAQDSLGQPRWSWNALRRRAVMDMQIAGIDPAAAASMTGHSVSIMLKHYRAITHEDQGRAAAVLDGRVIPVDFEVVRRASERA